MNPNDEERDFLMVPAIAAIRNQVNLICRSELERLERRLPRMSRQERRDLERMLRRIEQKIIRPAIRELRSMEKHEGPADKRLIIEALFGVH